MIDHNLACFVVSCRLASLAGLVSSLEFLAVATLYSDEGILSWKVMRTRILGKRQLLLDKVPDEIFDARGMGALFVVRIVLSLSLFTWASDVPVASGLLVALLVLQCVTTHRSTYGSDGSDQMLMILYAGLAAFIVLRGLRSFAWLGFGFIAFQACLSYVTAGIAKAIAPTWRNGDALPNVLNTTTYGNRRFSSWLGQHWMLSKASCLAIIVFECAFPLTIVSSKWLLISLLSCGLLFHLANAALMGLNVFFWSFAATYPSIIVINLYLTDALERLCHRLRI